MAAIFLTVAGFNLLGDGLRRTLDVRLDDRRERLTILTASDLTVAATLGGQHVEVIRRLSFKLAPGRILGIVGESGAGKSMIGRAIAHALPAGFAVTGGTLRLDDEDLVRLTPERRRALLGRDIAFIPQEPMTALNPVMTIGAQFAEHLRRLARRITPEPRAGTARRGASAQTVPRCCAAIRINCRAACASAC